MPLRTPDAGEGMSRIAVLGGTFDPVHHGHLAAAEQAREAVDAGEAWLVPAGAPPLHAAPLVSATDRLAMVEAAVADHPDMRVLDLEVRRPGPSYTIDTLAELSRLHPADELWLVMGADAAATIRSWHRADELLECGRFAVVTRRGQPPVSAAGLAAWGFPPGRSRSIEIVSPDIDATAIRRRIANGEPVTDLVPAAVARLIGERRLYRLR